jgi:GTP-binding protein
LKITSAEYIKSVYQLTELPERDLPEVSFFGRSNVGKSSLINCLLSQKMAKTSRTPGKTQCLNYFLINDRFYFVDAPGYGFAKVPPNVKKQWDNLMNDWINKKKSGRLIIHIIDSRHEPLESDLSLQKWLKKNNIQYLLVPNKIDKLKTQQMRKQIDLFRSVFKIEPENIIPFSSTEGTGKVILWKRISQLLFSNANQ